MSIQDEYAKAKAKANEKARQQNAVLDERCAALDALADELSADESFLSDAGWKFRKEQQGFHLENTIAWISPICFAPDGSYVVHHAYHSSKWSGQAPDVRTLQDVKRAIAELMVKYGKK